MEVKVCVIVPVYNVLKYISRCIDSILEQTLKEIEIILVNDGSTDTSGDICDEYRKRDSRIKVIHKENGGLSSARKAGFNISEGKYIIFIDSDDYIEATMLEKLYYKIIRTNADICMCGYFVEDENNLIPKLLPICDISGKKEIKELYIYPIIGRILTKNYINLPGFAGIRLYSSEILDDSCFLSEREYYTEDDLLNLIVAQKTNKIAVIQEALYHYCQHPKSLTYIYRPNVWEMLQKRYIFCYEYAQKYGYMEEVQERLYFSGFSAISNSLDNAVKGKKYREAREEFKIIFESQLAKEVLYNINFHLMTGGQKIRYLCFKYKLFGILYYIRKSRLNW